MLHGPGLILVPCSIVALLALWGRDDVGGLGFLVIGLSAGSLFGSLPEYFFWQMIYASHDTPPGFGWLQSATYTVCGLGILYLTVRRQSLAKPGS
jgi:hypothetical protein